MVFIPPYDIDPDPMGDTVSVGIEKNDGNVQAAYEHLNLLLSMIESGPMDGQQILDALAPVDGVGSGLDAEYLGGRIYSEYGFAVHTHDLVTTAAPGFMAVIDKQKLDGIQTGAETNVQSDWAQSSSSHDAFIRNKPKMVGTTGLIESGDVGVFYNATTLEGKNPGEMKTYLGYFEDSDFIVSSAGAGDGGKPIILDTSGLIHASMIPAVPAEAIWGGITGTLSNQTDLQAALDLKSDTSHNHDSVYEAGLGNPANDGEVLASTAAGTRSWVPMSSGSGDVDWGDIGGTLANQTDLQAELDAKSDTGHNHDGSYEASLGNPANDGEILSSLADGTRSWIPMSSGPGGVDWGAIGGTLSNQADLQAELDTLTDGLTARYLKTDFITVSTGVGDSGKPILLNSAGQVDSSMIDVSVFYYVGSFTPVAGTEYPDTTGESHGAFWVVQGVDAGTGYTFAGGDLTGMTVNNGDFMVWAAAGWSIMAGEMNPILYYRLDGSQPLTDHFRAGDFQLKDIADGTDAQDAVSKAQLDLKSDSGHNHDADYLAIDGKAVDADLLDGLSATAFEQNLGIPANDGEILSSTAAGVRSWIPAPAGGSDPDWGDIGGTLSNQADLQAALDAKEGILGNPSNDGYILSSTAAGTRSWIPAPSGGGGDAVWGSITGTLSDQDDLQDALDLKSDSNHDHVMGDITDLVFPVDSVNGKTGAVSLNAADVGALAVNGKAVDSSLFDGAPITAFSPVSHDHDSDYLSLGGGNLTGDIRIQASNPTIGLDAGSGDITLFEGTVGGASRGSLMINATSTNLFGTENGGSIFGSIRLIENGDIEINQFGTGRVHVGTAGGTFEFNGARVYTDTYHPDVAPKATVSTSPPSGGVDGDVWYQI